MKLKSCSRTAHNNNNRKRDLQMSNSHILNIYILNHQLANIQQTFVDRFLNIFTNICQGKGRVSRLVQAQILLLSSLFKLFSLKHPKNINQSDQTNCAFLKWHEVAKMFIVRNAKVLFLNPSHFFFRCVFINNFKTSIVIKRVFKLFEM